MLDQAFAAIDCFQPRLLSDSPFWRGHLPFAGVLVALIKPKTIVELGVQHGDSLFTFAEAMRRHGPDGGRVIGIDAWQGDAHIGDQPDWIYSRVLRHASDFPNVQLIRARFDVAADRISDGSIDLLHVDGGHAVDDVKADLEAYLPKLAPNAVVLMHDITAYRPDFGVWKAWQDLADAHPSFAFAHSAGLGVVAPKGVTSRLTSVLGADRNNRLIFKKLFATLGHHALIANSTPDQIARAKQIGQLALPDGLNRTPDLMDALIKARW